METRRALGTGRRMKNESRTALASPVAGAEADEPDEGHGEGLGWLSAKSRCLTAGAEDVLPGHCFPARGMGLTSTKP